MDDTLYIAGSLNVDAHDPNVSWGHISIWNLKLGQVGKKYKIN